jgi:uncharacterized protein (DUF362 family)/Pyruvate/2-oxoacid:ferredoxin oxidoreductase delta subunit
MRGQPTPVSLTRCTTYDESEVEAACSRLLAPLGGWPAFVRPNQRVLIKPNLLTDRLPDQAVTTHPAILRAIIRGVKSAGATPVMADSPASFTKLDRVWEKTGIKAVCDAEGIELLCLEKSPVVSIEASGFTLGIAKPVLDADVVITVPKVKTHVLTTLTAAVKNLYGTLPGYHKTALHRLHHKPDEFGRLIAAIYGSVKPTLALADGIVGMEGDGPSNGTPIHLGFLAASSDAAALDVCLCDLLGIPPEKVPYLAAIHAAGTGAAVRDAIRIVGDDPAALRPASFKLPRTLPLGWIPKWLVRALGSLVWIRPTFNTNCIFCKQCVEVCPGKALEQSGKTVPVLTPSRCIECCCCHEVCPAKAITMTGSPLLRLIRRGRQP